MVQFCGIGWGIGAPARFEIEVGAEEARRGRNAVNRKKKEYMVAEWFANRLEILFK